MQHSNSRDIGNSDRLCGDIEQSRRTETALLPPAREDDENSPGLGAASLFAGLVILIAIALIFALR